jgi:uncharacterized membrane protein
VKPAFRSGACIATAAAALILAGAVPAATQADHGDEAKGRCFGANACKGQGACSSANNSCMGVNACKGQGFLEMTKEDCDKIQGATFEPEKNG